jgi:hypothetical protein
LPIKLLTIKIIYLKTVAHLRTNLQICILKQNRMKLSSQHKQLSPDLIKSSLDKLPKDNRWVRLGDSLVWDEIERIYNIRAKRPDTGAAWTAACYLRKT